MSALDDYRRQADLPTQAGRYTDLRLVRHDSTWRGVCPLHHGATNPTSFHVFTGDDGSDRYVCYSCGAGGDVFAFLGEIWGMSYQDALEEWRRSEGRGRVAQAPQRARPARPQIEVLPPRQRIVANYHDLLGQQTSIVITEEVTPGMRATRPLTAHEWWARRGLSPQTIERFQLGYAPVCPTQKSTDSFAIPITYRDQVLNIRHRVANAPDGNKYRPQKAGLGAHLFNADGLDIAGDDALIVEGEIKAMALIELGVESLMPVVSSTAGIRSWLGGHGDDWYAHLHGFRRVFVLFDNEPDAWAVAQRTARIFGRRGRVVRTPGKPDDWVLASPEERLAFLINALGGAQPVIRL